EPRDLRKLQIQNDQNGKRMLRAVGIGALAQEMADRLLAIRDDLQRVWEGDFPPRVTHEECVVCLILHVEDRGRDQGGRADARTPSGSGQPGARRRVHAEGRTAGRVPDLGYSPASDRCWDWYPEHAYHWGLLVDASGVALHGIWPGSSPNSQGHADGYF